MAQQPGFDLYTFDTVIVVNVFHLMGENGCQILRHPLVVAIASTLLTCFLRPSAPI
jgi:hypothetical protein